MFRILIIATLAACAQAGWTQQITHADHVAAIINKHCVECHRPGMGAPMDFTTYDDTAKRARMIAKVVESGRMPPWKPERGHLPLEGERGLTADELTTLRAWADAGAPQGDPARTPPLPEFPDGGWRLGEPDLVVRMSEVYDVPAEGPDEYRNFVVPLPDMPEGTYIKGVEFRASAPSVVHHSLLNLDLVGLGRMMDEDDPGPGFAAMDNMFEDSRLAGFAVGSLPYLFPEGVARELKPGTDLVLETHFHPSGKVEREQSEVAFYFTQEKPTRELVHLPMPPSFGLTTGMDIPAGEPRYELKHRYELSHDVRLFHIFPHAHMVCREMKNVATFPDGTQQILLWIKDWDFAWQEQYRFTDMPILPAGTVLDLTFVYDNSAENPANPHNPPQRVLFGHQTTDEMASMSLNVVPVNDADAAALREAHFRYQRKQFKEVPLDYLQPVMKAELLRRFDKNRSGELGPFEIATLLRWGVDVTRKDPGYAWRLELLAFERSIEPEFKARAKQAITYASFAGITLLLLVVAGVTHLVLRWRKRRASV